jgi:hypothetical protein
LTTVENVWICWKCSNLLKMFEFVENDRICRWSSGTLARPKLFTKGSRFLTSASKSHTRLVVPFLKERG